MGIKEKEEKDWKKWENIAFPLLPTSIINDHHLNHRYKPLTFVMERSFISWSLMIKTNGRGSALRNLLHLWYNRTALCLLGRHHSTHQFQIGRASCRERVYDSVVL